MSRERAIEPLDRFDTRARTYTPDRVAEFNRANRDFPEARRTEVRLLIERMMPKSGLSICDLGAGGGYLSESIDAALGGACSIMCVENSESFFESIDPKFGRVLSSLGRIDLPAACMDRVVCLAGLHHQQRKLDVFQEAFRILRPGGRIAFADVMDGSPPARFLNCSVDRFTEIGHDGMFLEPGEFTQLMLAAGFASPREDYEQFTWDLPDRSTLVSFCRTLFRMRLASLGQVRDEIDRYLEVSASEGGAHLHWSLAYATGVKPD